MAFIRRKRIGRERFAFYLVENERVEGKLCQRVLAYIGPAATAKPRCALGTYGGYGTDQIDTLDRAVAFCESEIGRLTRMAMKRESEAIALRVTCKGPLSAPIGRGGQTTCQRRASRYWHRVHEAARLRLRTMRLESRVSKLRELRERISNNTKEVKQ